MLAKKVFKPWKTMVDAYEARLKPNSTNQERYRTYLNPKK